MEKFKDLRQKIANLSEEEKMKRDVYLRDLATGKLQGPPVGYPSIDKPWLKSYDEESISEIIPEVSVYEYFMEKTSSIGKLNALSYFGNKISYSKLQSKIDKYARILKAKGLKNGDVVSLVVPNLPETTYLFFALNKIGVTANMIDPRINKDQIEKFILDSKSKMVFFIDKCMPKLTGVAPYFAKEDLVSISAFDSLIPVLKFVKKSTEKKDKALFECTNINQFNKCKKASNAINSYNEIALIVYTTGTTGTPKGAKVTNRNIVSMAISQRNSIPFMKSGQKFLGIMPPFIAYGAIWGMIIPMIAGLELEVIPKFESSKFAELILKHKPNYIMGVPSHFEELIKNKLLENANLDFLLCPIVGGNAMTPASEVRVNEFLKSHGCPSCIKKGYGMTEVSSSIAFPNTCEVNKIGSVGIPMSKNNIKIVDKNLEEVPVGVRGEILLQGPIMIKGYLNNKEQEKTTFVKDSYGDSWVKSGDLGHMDSDGCLFLTGRSKRTLVRADGHNVFPGEMENVISQHESVDSCCVVGIKSIEYENGDVPVACVVLKDKYKGYEKEMEEKLKEFSLKYLQQRDVALMYVFLDKIPLLPDGKVDFRSLQAYVQKLAIDKPNEKVYKLVK